jgi:hypothetical protein
MVLHRFIIPEQPYDQKWMRAMPNVGASLLAMAAAQATLIQADPPLSRASSLPQENGGVPKSPIHPKTNVGASLLAMAAAQATLLMQAEAARDQIPLSARSMAK